MSKRTRILALILPVLLHSSMFAQTTSDAEAHFNRGESFLQSNQYNEAIKEFRQAINLKPKWPEAYFKLGRAYSAIPIVPGGTGENLKAALKAFEEAVRLNPEWAEALTELGSKYSAFQQYDKALKALQKAVALKPELAEAHENLAITYLRVGQYKEAIETLKEAVRLKPERPLPHKLLGLAYLVVDDRAKALEQYQILQSLEPEMAKSLNNAIQSPDKPTFGVATGKLISVPKPDYPAAARSLGVRGNVAVEVIINEHGRVTSARAINGPVELHQACEAAALKARFTPTKLSGTSVLVRGVITFSFVP